MATTNTTTNIKVCFFIDCTQSMEPWISAAKRQVQTIVDNTRAEFPNTLFKVGFIGYRDFGDENQFITIPFTSDIPSFLVQLVDVHAEGGDDVAEDVAGGLVKVLSLDWSDADVLSIVHIADAPAHGNTMHGRNIGDRFPKYDFDILTNIKRCAELKIDYTFIRIDDSTDVMSIKFCEEYEKFPERTFKLLDLSSQIPPPITNNNRRFRAEAVFVNDDGQFENGVLGEDVFTAEVTQIISHAVSRHTSSRYEPED
jgi:hypothetical protein